MCQEQNHSLSHNLIDYHGAISEMDDVIGKLRKLLQELGIKDNTLLWFSSDNGLEGLSPGVTNQLHGMKGSLYEGGVRVPLGITLLPERGQYVRVCTHAVTVKLHTAVLISTITSAQCVIKHYF